MKTVLMLGTFDSKGKEFDYLYSELKKRNVNIMTMDVGVFDPVSGFEIDISASEVALRGGESLESLRKKSDRGHAMHVMSEGARAISCELQKKGEIDAIISMGGGGGTSIAATAMQALPIGFPKVCITTLASGDTSEYVGTKDIVLYPSIVDICGINSFSKIIMSRGAGAVCGMAEMAPETDSEDGKTIFISMFGNSTKCVERCQALLSKDFSTMVFHATGGGGRTMEDLIMEGYCSACLDVTTTEWADELCGGILSAGDKRLDAPGKVGIPHVIAPGCLDMVNFGTWDTVPQKYKDSDRKFYEWNPMVTLMRTNASENRELGRILAEKANASKGPVAFVLPLRGLSILDGEGQCFCDFDTDRILFESIEGNLNKNIPVYKVDANINDEAFAKKAIEVLLGLMK